MSKEKDEARKQAEEIAKDPVIQSLLRELARSNIKINDVRKLLKFSTKIALGQMTMKDKKEFMVFLDKLGKGKKFLGDLCRRYN